MCFKQSCVCTFLLGSENIGRSSYGPRADPLDAPIALMKGLSAEPDFGSTSLTTPEPKHTLDLLFLSSTYSKSVFKKIDFNGHRQKD